MTLSVAIIEGKRAMVLLGLELDGKQRQWKNPLLVTLEVTPGAASDVRASVSAPATTASYRLSVPLLGVDGPSSPSILEAVRKLQEGIIAALPRDVLESLLVPLTGS
jgi:hypothetical protein